MGTVGEGTATSRTPADGQSLVESIAVEVVEKLYNGSNTDLRRNNVAEELLASATRSSAGSQEATNHNAEGVYVIVDATASNGDGTEDLEFGIEFQDPASGDWIDLKALAAIFSNGGTGKHVILIQQGAAAAADVADEVFDRPLPRDWRIDWNIVQGGAGTVDYTFSVGVQYVGAS